MREDGRSFRPIAEGCEPRMLLSTAHHPIPYVGTIHGDLVAIDKPGA